MLTWQTLLQNFMLAGSLGLGCLLCTATSLAAPTASELRTQGLLDRDQGRYPEAIAALKQSVELDPTYLAGRVLLGWTYHKAGQDAGAAEALTQAVIQDPRHVPALNALGIVYLVNGDLSAAVLTHSWAALQQPDNEIAYYNLSLALQRLQEYEWASLTAQLAADLEPENPHPFVALAIADWEHGYSDLAKQDYQEALNVDGRYSDPEFLNYLDEAGFSSQQIQTAKQILITLR
jgi:Flp pilus assembly protein TadD